MTTPPNTLTLRTPDDMLAAAPVILGFVPEHSVVMLTMGAAENFHARVDLPDDLTYLPETVELLVEPAERHEAPAIIMMVYSEDPELSQQVWAAMAERCAAARIKVPFAMRVTRDRWYGLDSSDEEADSQGFAYDLTTHPFIAETVLEGRPVLGTRDELAESLEADPDQVQAISTALREVVRAPVMPNEVVIEGGWIRRIVQRHVIDETQPSDTELARLLTSFTNKRLRDAAWHLIDRHNARTMARFWRTVLRRTPDSHLPPVASMLGWAAWQAGDGALAWCAVDRCLDVDPDYTMGNYLAHALSNALPPSFWDNNWDWAEGLTG